VLVGTAADQFPAGGDEIGCFLFLIASLLGGDQVAPNQHLLRVQFAAAGSAGGKFPAGIAHREELEVLKQGVNESGRKQQRVLEEPERMNLAAGLMRSTNKIKRAIRGQAWGKEIVSRIFADAGEFAGVKIELLDAVGAEAGEMAFAIAADARGLKDQLPG